MPYHVKTPGKLVTGDVYWKGDNHWTETYADRKQFANKADADAIKATTVTLNGITYQPAWFKNSTVVTE
tara:strand:+ start:227 stop:433 length:207 start_codon:yes stop_codon:yes gene_type:complete